MKNLMILLIVVLVSAAVIAELYPQYKTPFESKRYGLKGGVTRVTHYDPRVNFARVDGNVYLSPPGPVEFVGAGRGGYAPFYARGFARVQSSVYYGFPRAEVTLTTKDLPPSYDGNVQFEAWLVDVESGYRQSMGTFTTVFGGTGILRYRIDNYLDPYDVIEITVEPYPDEDLSPGPVVLYGRIPPPTFFDPPPKQSKLITNTYTKY
jgi:hypothetical protein